MCISPVSTVIFPKSETAMLSSFTFANIQGYRLRICPTLLLKVCLFSRAKFYLVSEQIHVTPLVMAGFATPVASESPFRPIPQCKHGSIVTDRLSNQLNNYPTERRMTRSNTAITGHAKVRLPSLCNAPWESWVYFGFGKQCMC